MREVQRPKRRKSLALPGLDLGRIFEEGFRNRTDPNDDWHKEDPEAWNYHASSLVGCDRQMLLKRLGEDTDGLTLEAALTFEVGHCYHRLLESFATKYEEVEPRFKVLAVEAGGTHPRLPLKARCDLLFSWDGEPILADLKTEKPQAAARRREEQGVYGFPYPYRYEHKLQIAAQAMVIEGLVHRWLGIKALDWKITQGRVCYVNKVNFAVDQVPCEITEDDRLQVMRIIQKLEDQYQGYKTREIISPRLTRKDEIWRCQPRSEADQRGKWCSCRTACFARSA